MRKKIASVAAPNRRWAPGWLNQVFPGVRVLQEASIRLSAQDTPYSDPEPDAIVLNGPFPEIPAPAGPEDIVQAVEVSDPPWDWIQ